MLCKYFTLYYNNEMKQNKHYNNIILLYVYFVCVYVLLYVCDGEEVVNKNSAWRTEV